MTSHGGKRDGAGRKPSNDRLERVTFYIGESQVIWLERYTDENSHSNLSQSLRHLLYERMMCKKS